VKTYNNKYQKWYDKLIDRARNRTIEGYVERHHIVPRSLGGTNEEGNLVDLTAREHLVAHMLLPRFVENKAPMWLAVYMMMHTQGRKHTGRLYEQAKIEFRGICKSRKYSPETLAKMSAAKKGRKKSPEHIAKMSATRKGKKKSPETLAKMSAARKGIKKTSEHIAKISAVRKGQKLSPGTIAKRQATRAANRIAKQAAGIDHPLKGRPNPKISAALKGRPNPKISAALKGKKKSPEAIAKRQATRAANRALKPFQYSSERHHQSPVQLS